LVQILSVVNQKGGVGKTTTAVNLAACLAHLGQNALLVDLDPQGNATSGAGLDKQNLSGSMFDVFAEDTGMEAILVDSSVKNLQVAPSNGDLLSTEWHLAENKDGKFQLKLILAGYLWNVSPDCQPRFIIIDCPPSFGQLSLNAVIAADVVLIPVQCEYYALEGLTEIMKSATRIRQQYNTHLSLGGILLTMADGRLNLSRQVEEDIREAYKDSVFRSVIQRSVRLSEAPSHGLPIIVYDPGSRGAESYLSLAQEVIDNEKKSPRPWPFRLTV